MSRYGRSLRHILVALLFVHTSGWFSGAQGNKQFERVLIEIPKPYDAVVAGIQARGGRVTRQYRHFDAIAAEIPVEALASIRALTGSATISKDTEIPAPTAAPAGHERSVGGKKAGPVTTVTVAKRNSITSAETFSLNNAGSNLEQLRALHPELTGAGIIVAVIDSGIRPGFPLLDSDDSVIGGEDFVGDGLGWSDKKNDGHGTFAAGLISGNAEFNTSGPLEDAIRAYAPPGTLNSSNRLPIIGTAPSSKIYALRVFGPGAGAQLSVVLAAIDRVIALRKDYDKGHGGLRIDVCNFSLGRSTRDAGHTVLEKAWDALAAAGIVGVTAAGDAGPSSLTTASPGSSLSALTVGGFNRKENERILRDLVFGRGTGIQYRPRPETQTYVFSSRGPNADGRIDPDVVASAVANLGQGYCPGDKAADACAGAISIASGTSFSAPIVAGIAAVLRQAFPSASAYQIRNALIATARTSLIEDGSTEIDRGAGVPDALAAYNLLAAGQAADGPPATGTPNPLVAVNVEYNTNLVVNSGSVTRHVADLHPGQRADILFDVPFGTGRVVVHVENITSSNPPVQNQIFGDGLSLDVHSAKTSAIGGIGDYLAAALPRVGETRTFDLTKLDTGIMRVTISGDTVNASNISADVTVYSLPQALSSVKSQGPIHDKQQIVVPIQIPPGVQLAEFLLSWEGDWSRYPTSDLDLRLFPPGGGAPVLTGATLNSPERVSLANPAAGAWLAVVDGFDIPDHNDTFQLRILLDGIPVN